MPDLAKIKAAIDERHLDSFKDFELVADPLELAPMAGFDDLVKWTKESMAQINNAKANSKSGDNIYTMLRLSMKADCRGLWWRNWVIFISVHSPPPC
jgi:hypothetical protein